ncbi:MAG TPA: peptidoglycan DD-metalloendopeptidase family protein [Rubrobacteraceae bacterium]|nr:peptidoglycan DD-metalloendopeptidase family protein [Rubrobacteraceae bacterium]
MTLCLTAVMGGIGPGASVEAQQARTQETEGAVVGASVVHPESWVVEREPYTYDGTYGYTLWHPDTSRPHDHGGAPAVRVALAYGLKPGQIEERVEERVTSYPDLSLERREVPVAARHKGVAVGPIPGSTPSTEVYVPVNGRVYRINVYGEDLDAAGRELLSSLRFAPPSRPVEELALPAANSPEALYSEGEGELAEREQAAHVAALGELSPEGAVEFSATGGGGETKIKEGCWTAASDFFVQTQHGRYANERGGDGIPTGYTVLGKPNYWNEYSHGRLGYGRCKARVWTNDKYAIDYPLNRGDVVFSPFKRGKVTFAGRNTTHKDYGILVSIRASNGKYVSLSAHLSGLAKGIKRGARVDANTVIGFAGDSGGGDIAVGRVHLHQAFYRYPSFNRDGSPYGGRGLKVVRHNYTRKDGGVYRYGFKSTREVLAKGDRASN